MQINESTAFEDYLRSLEVISVNLDFFFRATQHRAASAAAERAALDVFTALQQWLDERRARREDMWLFAAHESLLDWVYTCGCVDEIGEFEAARLYRGYGPG